MVKTTISIKYINKIYSTCCLTYPNMAGPRGVRTTPHVARSRFADAFSRHFDLIAERKSVPMAAKTMGIHGKTIGKPWETIGKP
jgi:hypothetical protein